MSNSEEKRDEVGRLMLLASREALGPSIDLSSGVDTSELSKRVIRSIKAARCVDLEQGRSGPDVYLVAASAFWCWVNDYGSEDIDRFDVYHSCVGGAPFLAFAQGMIAAYMATSAASICDDEQLTFAGVDEGVDLLIVGETWRRNGRSETTS